MINTIYYLFLPIRLFVAKRSL